MRLAREEDMGQIAELAIEAMVEQRDHKASIDNPFDLFNLSAYMYRMHSAIVHGGSDILIETKDDVVAAFMWIGLSYQEPWSSVLTGTMVQLYVGEDLRGSRVVLKMIKSYERWCKRFGVKYCHLGISSGIYEDNTVKLYKKLGYDYSSQHFIKEL